MTKNKVAPFRIHKGTGQAYVNLDRRRVYLGRADTPEAKQCYARVIGDASAVVRFHGRCNPRTSQRNRRLRLLQSHGLIRKVSKTHR